MKNPCKTFAICLFAGVTRLAAADCTKAVTPIDKVVCKTPNLSKLDADLNHLYTALRHQLTTRAKADLLTQQRTWLATRNKECATADPVCLKHQYADRIDQLRAIGASANAAEDKLSDVAPVYLKGNWKVTAIQDPAGNGHTDPAALKQSLSDADLHPVGTTVKTSPGTLCLASDTCGQMAWNRAKLSGIVAGEAISGYLKLSPSTLVLQGTSGSKESYYVLIPQPNGTLWAVFGLCGPAVGQDCRQAAEVWTPNPDGTIFPKP